MGTDQKNTQKEEQKKATPSTEIVEKISEGKIDKLMGMIPEGQSPKLYIELIKEHVMGLDKQKNPRPDEDLLLFLYTAKRTGLDPLTKQIYAVFRWDSRIGREKMAIQSGIDGFRLVAQRTGQYAGQDDVIYDPKDEATTYPKKASVTVYKIIEGQRVPFTATARWGEYVATDRDGNPDLMWKKMPYLMLGKCAEALALRKAFPNELSGIYTEEEMMQSGNPLGALPTPDRFNKETPSGTPTVLHGAPEDNQNPVPQIGTDESAQQMKSAPPDMSTEAKERPIIKTKSAQSLISARKKIREMQSEKKADESEEVSDK